MGSYDRHTSMRLLMIVVCVLLAGAACGGEDTASVATSGKAEPPDAPSAADDGTRYRATTTVLESPDHGPQLCLGGVQESYPPQCSGPEVIGWDWDVVQGEESANGTTWGTYTVVGTWDGEALTLTEPAASPEPPDSTDSDQPRFSTPCPEPAAGWKVVDESATSDQAMQAAIGYARSQPTVGGVWIDQSINPAFDENPIEESRTNDPTRLILNVSFTDDLEAHEAAIRGIWGGLLCVSEAPVTAAELAEIRAEVEADVGDFLFSSTNEVEGRVHIGVAVDDGLQERVDERYGSGVVDVQAQLRPVDA